MDNAMRFFPEETTAPKKRPVWRVVLIVIAALAVIAVLWWWIADPFFAPPETSFEDAKLLVERQSVPVAPQRRIGQDGCVFTVMDADLYDMTVTIGLSEPRYHKGEEYRKITLRYDEAITLYKTKEASLASGVYADHGVQVSILFPDLTEADREGLQDVTVYRVGDMAVELHEAYYACYYGKKGEDVVYGTYENNADTLILRETAGITRGVFVREGDGYRYDAKSSYRHKTANTPSLGNGEKMRPLYRRQITRGEDRKYEWVIYAANGEELVRESGLNECYGQCTVNEDSILRLQTRAEDTRVRFIRLETGEVSKAYEPVLYETAGAIVYRTNDAEKTIVTVEPIPWSKEAIAKPLTVTLPKEPDSEIYTQAYIGEGKVVVSYDSITQEEVFDVPAFQVTDAVVLTLDGETVTAPLVVTAPGEADHSGNLTATSVSRDDASKWSVTYYGIQEAFRLRGNCYCSIRAELQNGTLTPERLKQDVLDDIASGKATKTVYADGVSFTACYGGEFENITYVYVPSTDETVGTGIDFYTAPKKHRIYIGAVPPLP